MTNYVLPFGIDESTTDNAANLDLQLGRKFTVDGINYRLVKAAAANTAPGALIWKTAVNETSTSTSDVTDIGKATWAVSPTASAGDGYLAAGVSHKDLDSIAASAFFLLQCSDIAEITNDSLTAAGQAVFCSTAPGEAADPTAAGIQSAGSVVVESLGEFLANHIGVATTVTTATTYYTATTKVRLKAGGFLG